MEHVLIDPHILGTPLIGIIFKQSLFYSCTNIILFTDKKVELFDKIKNEIRLENDKKLVLLQQS